MAIKVACSKCGGSFSAEDKHAGRQCKCPRCQEVLVIPVTTAAATTPPPLIASHHERRDPIALMAEIRNAFQGKIPRSRPSLSYQAGVLLVTLLMLLLPGIYLSIAVLVGYGMYLHLVGSTFLLASPRLVTVIAYAGPLAVGGILLFFMVKPLFAGAPKTIGTRSLTRDGEPVLFAFVDSICAAVGSAPPRRIDVDSQVNASASFRNGWRSLFCNDLVLTIGVPLVAGLNTRQFAGVLAHEFGHFSQGTGMRLTYLIRSINAWFERVVYHRDEWDVWLEETAQDTDWRIAIVLYLAMFCVGVTRRILWGLMMLGHLGSSFFLREMEYDADRYEANLAGSDVFESTQLRIGTLAIAGNSAMQELRMILKEGKLADNLPKYMVTAANSLDAATRLRLHQKLTESKTGWFDTHPSDAQRMASAQRERAPGIFHLERPATQLFTNFDQLAKNVTVDVYRSALGQTFDRSAMQDTDELLARRNKDHDSDKAIDAYCQGCFSVLRQLQLPAATPVAPAIPQSALTQLKEARERFLAERDRYVQLLAEYDRADTQLMQLKQVHELLYAILPVKAKDYEVTTTSTSAVARAREEAQTVQGRLDEKLKVCETALGERLHLALRLLFVPQVAARIATSEKLRQQAVQAYEGLVRLTPYLSTVTQLRNEFSALTALCARLHPSRNSEVLIDAIRHSLREVARLLRELREELLRIPYPFENMQGDMSIGKYCVPTLPLPDELGDTMHATSELLQTIAVVYQRLISRLVVAAEQVETVAGLPKLAAPPAAAPTGTA